jgi:hypothetical protein
MLAKVIIYATDGVVSLSRAAQVMTHQSVLVSYSFYNVFSIADGVAGIATGYGLNDRGVGVRVLVGSRIFSSPRCLDWLWGPPNLLSNGY